MASNQKQGSHKGDTGRNASQRRAPEWADGLKQLYDSVVEEDLPDSFKDLLDQLDGLGSGQAGQHGAAPSRDGRGAAQ
jgi:hypothetical protein